MPSLRDYLTLVLTISGIMGDSVPTEISMHATDGISLCARVQFKKCMASIINGMSRYFTWAMSCDC